jgi:membrane-associated phospholipid phosphatase
MELKIVEFLNKFENPAVSAAAAFVGRIRVLVLLWSVIAVGILFLDKTNGQIIFLALAIASVLHFLISEGIFKMLLPKYFKTRVRPYLAHPEIIRSRGSRHKDSSFPSSHMSTTLAMLTVLVFFYPVVWPLALIFALFMAYARMHNGMHYPSDILAGTAFGMIYGVIAIYLVR